MFCLLLFGVKMFGNLIFVLVSWEFDVFVVLLFLLFEIVEGGVVVLLFMFWEEEVFLLLLVLEIFLLEFVCGRVFNDGFIIGDFLISLVILFVGNNWIVKFLLFGCFIVNLMFCFCFGFDFVDWFVVGIFWFWIGVLEVGFVVVIIGLIFLICDLFVLVIK